jgi:hypothetical protein
MPSKSKSQQRIMGLAYAYKSGDVKSKDLNPKYADEVKKISKSMTKKQLKDFAKTKHKGLPEKVEERIMTFNSFVKENYTFEDFTLSDMEYVKELYEEGLTDVSQLSIETDLSEEVIKQILYTLRKRGDIN